MSHGYTSVKFGISVAFVDAVGAEVVVAEALDEKEKPVEGAGAAVVVPLPKLNAMVVVLAFERWLFVGRLQRYVYSYVFKTYLNIIYMSK